MNATDWRLNHGFWGMFIYHYIREWSTLFTSVCLSSEQVSLHSANLQSAMAKLLRQNIRWFAQTLLGRSLSLSLSLTFCLSVLSFLLSLQPNLDAYIGRTVESLVNGPTLSNPRRNLVRSRTSWLRIRSILGLLLLQDLKHFHPWLPVAPTSSRASKATFSQECSMTPHM